LQQTLAVGLAPGHRVEVRAMARCATPDNLHLIVRYQRPGFQVEQHAVHPGGGAWAPVAVALDVPPDADPNSITIELARMAGGAGDALVDGVEVAVSGAGASLDPQTPYVLSLAVRTESLQMRDGADRKPAGRVYLRWRDGAGTPGETLLMKVYNDPAWRKLSAVVEPGRDFPVDLSELTLDIGIAGGTGTLWVDQVQLEPGRRPTLYTPDVRLPHDEAIAGLDLESVAVSVPWDG